MSQLSAAFFAWVQGAQFYIDVHSEAVNLLPAASGVQTWLDLGCGPGLVARLAFRRGYVVTGIDRDPRMIERARRLAPPGNRCQFVLGDLHSVQDSHSANVVSAASLLFVVADPEAALAQLWNLVRPGGKLLVVETTAAMSPKNAFRAMRRVRPGRRIALALWAQARNARVTEAAVFETLAARGARRSLLHGMVCAWVWERQDTRPPGSTEVVD